MDLNEARLGAAAQAPGPGFGAAGALWQVLQPYLGLRQIMLLAGSCRAWHQLITLTPVRELSEEARRAVIPSGLTCSLPLLPLVKQQAQLIARISGKHGALLRIQHLRFDVLGHTQTIQQTCLVDWHLHRGCKPLDRSGFRPRTCAHGNRSGDRQAGLYPGA